MADIVTDIQGKIREYLKDIYGDNFEEIDGHFIVSEGSALVQAVVRSWHEDDAVVDCFSYVVEGADINHDLTDFLLRKNAELHFGAFGVIFDNTIVFSHAIAGKNMNKTEFEASLKTVAKIADFYDDDIRKIAGGKRAADSVEI